MGKAALGKGLTCLVPSCQELRYAKKRCSRHYQRMRRGSSVHLIRPGDVGDSLEDLDKHLQAIAEMTTFASHHLLKIAHRIEYARHNLPQANNGDDPKK